jgi:universal stress protein E
MKTFQRILVVCDAHMTSSPALRRGIDLAQRSRAELHLCIFDYDPAIELTARHVSDDVARRARKEFLQERSEWLAQQVAACAEQGLHVECEAIWAPRLDEAIVATTLEIKPDLVIKDVRTQSAIRRFLFLPRDWKLVRFCPAPLMLVAEGSDTLPRRVLAAIDAWEEMPDPSPLNQAVFHAATQVASYSAGTVDIVSVAPLLPVTSSVYRHIAPVIDDVRRDHDRVFREFAERVHVPAERRHAMIGDPAPCIGELAERDGTDLVVLGTHFRSGIDRLFLGNTAESLLNQVQCDVLLIKPAGVLEEITKHLGIPTGQRSSQRSRRRRHDAVSV